MRPGIRSWCAGNRTGFTSVIVRNREPVLVRTCVCDRESRADELHRFALYYSERLNANGGAVLTRMLATGGIDAAEARRAVADATDSEPHQVDAAEFGVDLAGEAIRFDHLAGAGGLATLPGSSAWKNSTARSSVYDLLFGFPLHTVTGGAGLMEPFRGTPNSVIESSNFFF